MMLLLVNLMMNKCMIIVMLMNLNSQYNLLFDDELAWYKCYNDELRNVFMMLLLVNLMMNKCMIIMMLNCIQYLYNLSYLMMFTSASWTHDFFEDELHDRSVVMMNLHDNHDELHDIFDLDDGSAWWTCMIQVS